MYLLISPFLIIISFLIILYYKLWWKPVHLQNLLLSQGLKGPSYKFIHGNTKDILKMTKEAISTPMDLSQHDLFPRILPHFYTWMKLYGDNFLIWIGDQPQLVVTEPELVKEILTNKEGVYKKNKFKGHAKKIFGGLLVAEGEKWSKLRKLANRSFHGECLKDMAPAMVKSVESMLERWITFAGKEIEVSNEFKLLTSEVISRTAFGSSYQEGKNIFETLTKIGAIARRNAYKIRILGKTFKSKDDVEADKMDQFLRDSVMTLIRKREDNVMSGKTDNFGSDYLGLLLEVHHDMDLKKRISVNDIVDECKLFYTAGHETTSSLLSWTILLLSVYTDWQEKAREEAVQLIGQENPSTESIAKLKILTMIVNEVLRLYSPAVQITRQVDCKTKLGKYEIPANIQISVPALSLHMNPDIWGKDAHVFKPERFSIGIAKASKGNSVAFIPFGFGPRTCVGLNFAANEVKIALSMILQHYKFTMSPNYVHSPAQTVTINPQHGIQIILQPL